MYISMSLSVEAYATAVEDGQGWCWSIYWNHIWYLERQGCDLCRIEYSKKPVGRIPSWVSAPITDASRPNRFLAKTEAFCDYIPHAKLISVGLNCALGPNRVRPIHRRAIFVLLTPHVSSSPQLAARMLFGWIRRNQHWWMLEEFNWK